LHSRKYAWLFRQDRLSLIIRLQFSAMLLVYVHTDRTEQKLEAIPMIRIRFFSIAMILVLGLFLAVLLLPGGAFAQDANTASGPNGQMGPAAGSRVTVYGWHHDQMHANAGQGGTGQAAYPMMSTAHMSHHANMTGPMTGPMTGTMAGMHAGMTGSGMGHMPGVGAEHGQHMAATGACPLADEDAAEHAAACPYQTPTTAGE
jgi:hypothetical protein